jgi:Xaa-Pro aminopeptidase
MHQLLQEVLSGWGEKRIGIESAHLSLAEFEVISDLCQEVQWVPTSDVVERQRMIKDGDEIARTRRAVEIAQRSFQSVVPMLHEGCSELEIAHDLEAKMRVLGAQGVSFSPIVAAGAGGALPHYHPRHQTIGSAATLLIDWGACYQGYASDLTRTLHRQHATDHFRRCYDSVLEAQLAAIDAIGPGVEARVVDAAARGVLQRAGLNEAFMHGLGHGTGLQIHESPRMSAASREVLASGMIITVEPGVYFEGDFGIRIEDDILVTDEGCEVLSRLPKGLDDCRIML